MFVRSTLLMIAALSAAFASTMIAVGPALAGPAALAGTFSV